MQTAKAKEANFLLVLPSSILDQRQQQRRAVKIIRLCGQGAVDHFAQHYMSISYRQLYSLLSRVHNICVEVSSS